MVKQKLHRGCAQASGSEAGGLLLGSLLSTGPLVWDGRWLEGSVSRNMEHI